MDPFLKPKRKLVALLSRLRHPAESSLCQKLSNCFSHNYEISFTWQFSQFTDLFPETLTRLYTNVFLEQEGRWCCLVTDFLQLSCRRFLHGRRSTLPPPCRSPPPRKSGDLVLTWVEQLNIVQFPVFHF